MTLAIEGSLITVFCDLRSTLNNKTYFLPFFISFHNSKFSFGLFSLSFNGSFVVLIDEISSFSAVQTYAFPFLISFSAYSYIFLILSEVYVSLAHSTPSHFNPSLIAFTYSSFSFLGLVSSNLRIISPSFSFATV